MYKIFFSNHSKRNEVRTTTKKRKWILIRWNGFTPDAFRWMSFTNTESIPTKERKEKKKERESPRKIISRCRSKGTMARNDRQRENDWDAARRKTRLGTNGLENAGWRQHRAEERHPGPLTTLAYKLWFLIMLLHPQTSTLSTTFFPPCLEGGNQYRKLGRLSMSLDVVRGMRTYVSFNLSRFPRQLSLFLSQTIRSSLTASNLLWESSMEII